MQKRGEIVIRDKWISMDEKADKHCTNCGHEWGKNWRYELYDEYHHLFTEIPHEEKIGWIECHDGWKEPVKRFLNLLDKLPKTNCKENEEIQISQIKQKFGMARVNVSYPKKLGYIIEGYIGRLEGECYMTCEYCGQAHTNGIFKGKKWLYCVCNDCKANCY